MERSRGPVEELAIGAQIPETRQERGYVETDTGTSVDAVLLFHGGNM